MRADLGPQLPALKTQLLAQVDAAAEAARQRFLTPGAGQALEYQATETEAHDYAAAGYPTFDAALWPFLAAELAALAEAGQPSTAEAVADQVLAQSTAWRAVGAAIKQLRRTAKLAIAAAETATAARAAAVVTWPQP
jgi:hypothetical protein